VDALELARRLGAAAAPRALAPLETRPGAPADLRQYVRETVRGYFHPVGTCRMGGADEDSVVGWDGRVHGFDNLLVADASAVPETPRANTLLTVLAVAERIAELV